MIDSIETESKLRLSFSTLFKNIDGIDSVLVRAERLNIPQIQGLDISLPSGIILIVDNLTVDQIVDIVSEIQNRQEEIFELAKAKSVSMDEEGDDLIELDDSLNFRSNPKEQVSDNNPHDDSDTVKISDSNSELSFFTKLINLLN